VMPGVGSVSLNEGIVTVINIDYIYNRLCDRLYNSTGRFILI
jgi:hypothetical protein